MTFEEEFPSLKDKTFTIYSFEPVEVGDKMGAIIEAQSDFVMEVEQIEFKELSNPILTTPPKAVMLSIVHEHTRDAQRINEAIEKVRKKAMKHFHGDSAIVKFTLGFLSDFEEELRLK